jgi:hypothetical protein
MRTSITRSRRASASRLCGALLAFATLICATPARAFGNEGHEVIALVAQPLLTSAAQQRLASVFASEPGATLASIANWADQTRSRSTAAWHYVNLPRSGDCVYVAARDCPDGNCVVAALRTQALRLASPATSPSDQLEALKYVIHFVGDVHQPLHAGFADDRGGNTYQLQAFGRGTNLHALWDTALLQDIDSDPLRLAATLKARDAPTEPLAFAPEVWAAESCRIASRPDFYPSRKVDAAYLATFEPIVASRLQLAGRRLAALLNDLLGAPR